MRPLIDNITRAKKYVRLPFINNTTELADFVAAQKRYILPILGKPLYTTVETEAVGNGTPSTLLDAVLRAVAPLAYAIDLPNMNIKISDVGVGQTSTDNFTPAPRWAFLQLREMLFDKGADGLEELLILLNEDKPEGVTWAIPDTFNTVIKTGKEFTTFYPIYQPYRTFESLRPVVKLVTDETIIPAIGEPFLTALLAKASPSADEKAAMLLIKKCVAQLTIAKAAAMLPVRISAEGWTVALLQNNEQNNQGQAQAPAIQMQAMTDAAKASGEGYLQSLFRLLNTKAASNVFAEYFTSDLYKAPTTVIEAPFNENSNSFFL